MMKGFFVVLVLLIALPACYEKRTCCPIDGGCNTTTNNANTTTNTHTTTNTTNTHTTGTTGG